MSVATAGCACVTCAGSRTTPRPHTDCASWLAFGVSVSGRERGVLPHLPRLPEVTSCVRQVHDQRLTQCEPRESKKRRAHARVIERHTVARDDQIAQPPVRGLELGENLARIVLLVRLCASYR